MNASVHDALRHAGHMHVRRLTAGDETVAGELVRLFAEEGDVDAVRDVAPALFLRRPEAVMFVAEDESGPCGCVYGHELVHPDGVRTMLLYSLDVAKQVRQRGYGVALVDAFVDHARAIGCDEVWVLTDDANVAALATYRAAGGQRDPADQVMFVWALS
jgi:ribosomal protein S18 acetylase RimI-like enzyme